MTKLPPEFVKAPATEQPKQPRAKKPRQPTLISSDPVKDPREIVLYLTEEEYQALEEARHKLSHAGTQITLEQMIHRVFAGWMVRARAIVEPIAAAVTAPAETPAHRQRDERLIVRLRAFVAAPLRTWTELGGLVRRYLVGPS